MAEVGSLVRIKDPPPGTSVLEWWLIHAPGGDMSFIAKTKQGLQAVVDDSNIAQEFKFDSFEISTLEQLTEYLVMLNLKIDIWNTPLAYSPSPYSGAMGTGVSSGLGGFYGVPGGPGIPTTTISAGTTTGSIWPIFGKSK